MKHSISKVCVLLLIIFVISSCHKNNIDILETNRNLTVDDAKNWFRSTIVENTKARKNQDALEKLTFWDYAKSFESNGQNVIMLPVQYKDYIYISKSISENSDKNTTGLVDFDIYTTMFYMMKRDKDGTIKGTFLKYIADKEYLVKNNYKKIDNSFTGTLIISNWNEEIEEIHIIKNGQINDYSPSAKGRSAYGCATISIDYFSVACAYGSCGDPQFIQTISHTICSDGMVNPDAINYTTIAFGGMSGPSYDYVLNQPDVQAWLFNSDMYPDEQTYYITHPWLILPALRNRNDAVQRTQSLYNTNVDDINANAFKHAYWSALNTITWDDGVATFMGNLHEASGPGSPTQHNMDQINNRLGIGIANGLKNQLSDPKDLKRAAGEEVLNAIDNGRGVRIVGGQLVPTDSSGH